MDEAIKREIFKLHVKKIIGIDPDDLHNFIAENHTRIPRRTRCIECKNPLYVHDNGWTEENAAILVKYIIDHDPSILREICLKKTDKFQIICYSKKAIPIISDALKFVFPNIEAIASIIAAENSMQSIDKKIRSVIPDTVKNWNEFHNGINTLVKINELNGFENVVDMVKIEFEDFSSLSLHGHQLRKYYRGQRKEDFIPYKEGTHTPIERITVGHFHKLGFIKSPGFDGEILLGGCFLHTKQDPSPALCYPEILSNLGQCAPRNYYDMKFEIFRKPRDYDDMKENYSENMKSFPWSTEKKLNSFQDLLKKYSIVLPGNHDHFYQAYYHPEKINSNPLTIGLGDYVDFDENDVDVDRKIADILEKNGYVPKKSHWIV